MPRTSIEYCSRSTRMEIGSRSEAKRHPRKGAASTQIIAMRAMLLGITPAEPDYRMT